MMYAVTLTQQQNFYIFKGMMIMITTMQKAILWIRATPGATQTVAAKNFGVKQSGISRAIRRGDIPERRGILAARYVDTHKCSQKEAAEKFGLTQSAVSQAMDKLDTIIRNDLRRKYPKL